jgi:propionyl-CoA carboxylase alpha chain
MHGKKPSAPRAKQAATPKRVVSRKLTTKVKKTLKKPIKKVSESITHQSVAQMSLVTDPSTFPPLPGSADGEKPLFDKLLVANRGEIACRIFRTCRKLGIKTVAVYSEADKNSQHVLQADEAICIGPAAALDSYLRPERILEAAKLTGAQAVHPGYGFLSENAPFAKLLTENNIKFVGPRHETISEMGDKIKSKNIAAAVNVKPIPGFRGAIIDETHLLEIANGIGYPVMVKAAHGGGGKGMRRADNDEECREGYRLSTAEAKIAFNSSEMLVEKFIVNPRHIEFQVIADSTGNAVFVNERECSVQRRNQKLVEEAPSTFLNVEQRARIGSEAVAIAKQAKYENAGTVEFLMGEDGQHYYLEMNTRLQVEHPITEMISGLDLVEQQIRVAAGLPLSVQQSDIANPPTSWAIESRVCAEDPINGFLPAVGTLRKFITPRHARVDQGFVQGDEISIHYDSLLAKVITHAPTRTQAMKEMAEALDSTVIHGLSHNICFLREVMEHPKFVQGDLTTNFIQDNFPHGFTGHVVNQHETNTLISGALTVHLQKAIAQTQHLPVSEAKSDLMTNKLSDLVITTTINGKPKIIYAHTRSLTAHGEYRVDCAELDSMDDVEKFQNGLGEFDKNLSLHFHANRDPSQVVFSLQHESLTYSESDFDSETAQHDLDQDNEILQTTKVSNDAHEVGLLYKGSPYNFNFFSPAEAKLIKHMPEKPKIDLSKTILSPMPGAIFSVDVQVGQKVAAGQQLCIVEAMKMQNSIKATKPAIVKAIHTVKGATVSGEELLIELADIEEEVKA